MGARLPVEVLQRLQGLADDAVAPLRRELQAPERRVLRRRLKADDELVGSFRVFKDVVLRDVVLRMKGAAYGNF